MNTIGGSDGVTKVIGDGDVIMRGMSGLRPIQRVVIRIVGL